MTAKPKPLATERLRAGVTDPMGELSLEPWNDPLGTDPSSRREV
jgi:hypothetical protein